MKMGKKLLVSGGGGFASLTPTRVQRLCPWTPLGDPPQTSF